MPRHQTSDVHFDPVDTTFDLAAHLGNDFVPASNHLAVTHDTAVRDEPTRRAANTGPQGIAAGGDAWAGSDASFDGIAKIHANLEDGVGIHDAGNTRLQHASRITRGRNGGQAMSTVEEQLVVRIRFIKTDMAVSIDKAGHDRATGHVHRVHTRHLRGLYFGRRTGGSNLLANDEHRLDARGSAGTIDDATVDDERGVHVQSFRPSKRRALSASQRGASSLPPLAG